MKINRRGFLSKMSVAVGGMAAISMGLPVLKVEAKKNSYLEDKAKMQWQSIPDPRFSYDPYGPSIAVVKSHSLTIDQLPPHTHDIIPKGYIIPVMSDIPIPNG